MTEDEETPLWEWCETMQPRLARLEAFEVPGFPLDYSQESLDQLEEEVLARYPFDDRPGSRASFTEAAMGYLGEALLNTAGGHWGWDDEGDMPVAHFDPELQLAPIAPLRLIIEAGQRRTGREFARVQAQLQDAVVQRRKDDPSWSPTKEPTPGLDVVETPLRSTYLDGWLPERQRAFPRWIDDYAGGRDGWDFSAGSLDLLQAVLLDHVRTVEEFEQPEHRDLVEGAVWYLGEVYNREAGTQWWCNDGEQDPMDPFIGCPYVTRFKPTDHSELPYYTLQNTVDRATPGYLRGRLDFFNS